MRISHECKSMDHAGALHNALLDNLEPPIGREWKVRISLDQQRWFVIIEDVEKKKPHESEAVSRGD